MRRLLQRVGLVIAIGAVAVVCLSSAVSAAIVGIVIAVVVAIDMLVLAPSRKRAAAAEHHTPETLSVDLSRRR